MARFPESVITVKESRAAGEVRTAPAVLSSLTLTPGSLRLRSRRRNRSSAALTAWKVTSRPRARRTRAPGRSAFERQQLLQMGRDALGQDFHVVAALQAAPQPALAGRLGPLQHPPRQRREVLRL